MKFVIIAVSMADKPINLFSVIEFFFFRYAGKPLPSVQWKRNGENLKENQRVQAETVGKDTLFDIKNCGRDDAGLYEIVVSNTAGTKTIPVKVRFRKTKCYQ